MVAILVGIKINLCSDLRQAVIDSYGKACSMGTDTIYMFLQDNYQYLVYETKMRRLDSLLTGRQITLISFKIGIRCICVYM